MKTFISIIIAICTAINGFSAGQITQDNLQDYLASDCESVAEFLAEHLDMFVSEYNETLEEGDLPFQATSCEFSLPVTITTTGEKGVYLDFDGDNGYLIVVDNYEVAGYATTGDLAYLRELDFALYSLLDGFVYYDEEGALIPYEAEAMSEEDWDGSSLVPLEAKNYAGQTTRGNDGEIYDPDAFVKSKYGTGYSVYQQKTLPNFKFTSQYDLSIYYQVKNGSQYSEGNCALSAIYALMNYLQSSKKYSKLPASTEITSYNAVQNDSFYTKYKNKGDYRITTPKILPKLYSAIRSYAIQKHGYEVSGINPFDLTDIIEQVGKQYGCSINATHVLIWSYENQAVKEIDAGYPTLWNSANSSTYGSHSTVVVGYKTYRKEKTLLGLKLYSYVKLLALNDNWNTSVRYFDFTNYLAFGSFVKVR